MFTQASRKRNGTSQRVRPSKVKKTCLDNKAYALENGGAANADHLLDKRYPAKLHDCLRIDYKDCYCENRIKYVAVTGKDYETTYFYVEEVIAFLKETENENPIGGVTRADLLQRVTLIENPRAFTQLRAEMQSTRVTRHNVRKTLLATAQLLGNDKEAAKELINAPAHDHISSSEESECESSAPSTPRRAPAAAGEPEAPGAPRKPQQAPRPRDEEDEAPRPKMGNLDLLAGVAAAILAQESEVPCDDIGLPTLPRCPKLILATEEEVNKARKDLDEWTCLDYQIKQSEHRMENIQRKLEEQAVYDERAAELQKEMDDELVYYNEICMQFAMFTEEIACLDASKFRREDFYQDLLRVQRTLRKD